MITREWFEGRYAERSGVTVEWLHEHGRQAEPCDCGDVICEGWQMAHEDYEVEPPPVWDLPF